MKRRRIRRAIRRAISKTLIALIIVMIAVIGVVAYLVLRNPLGSQTTPIVSTTLTTYTATSQTQQITLIGGGSTAIDPQMQAWARFYRDEISKGSVVINYQGIGSGAGQKGIIDGSLDFAGSDIPLTKDNYETLKSSGRGFIQIPVIGMSIAVVYNIPEWDQSKCGNLRLTPQALAGIYLGKIVYWDDPAIKSVQAPQCQDLLPHKEIYAVHRSDGSGSTAFFTMYLSKTVPEWNSTVGWGLVVNWPVDATGRGIGGKGSPGVIAAVKNTPYSIGYVEPEYANREGVPIAALQNKEGNFVLPTIDNVKEALRRGAALLPPPDAYWGSVPLAFIYQDGPNTYPMSGTSYIIISTTLPKSKAEALKAFFTWVLTQGQSDKYVLPGYVPLPKELADKALEYINMLQGK